MTLWNIIRDFFVQYIFGGYDSFGNAYSQFNIGSVLVYIDNDIDEGFNATTNDLSFKVSTYGNNFYTLNLGDWLSTTMTIITLIAICFFLFLVVRWLFRLTAGLIQGRG